MDDISLGLQIFKNCPLRGLAPNRTYFGNLGYLEPLGTAGMLQREP